VIRLKRLCNSKKDKLFWLLGDKQGDWMKAFLWENFVLPCSVQTKLRKEPAASNVLKEEGPAVAHSERTGAAGDGSLSL
jgi:hypothetical protein